MQTINPQSTALTASDTRPTSDALAALEEILARLTASITVIETACVTSNVASALARNRAAFYAAMDALGGWINVFLAAAPSAAKIEAAKERITGLIRPWSRTSPFFDRSYGKLRGYPGDYETIEIIYNCRPSGADLRAHIFDDYYLWTVTARAIRNRLTCLIGWLGAGVQAWVAQGLMSVRVLSLGSGSARELALLADDPVFSQVAAVTCLDQDPEALRYARSRINGRMNNYTTYLLDNALRFTRDANRPSQPYHIIYAGGLFDYLPVDQARQLIEDCHELLAPGGRLIVGNFGTRLPANERALLEWLLEWYLTCRGEEDYRRIFANTSFGVARLHFEYEPLAVSFLTVAERSR